MNLSLMVWDKNCKSELMTMSYRLRWVEAALLLAAFCIPLVCGQDYVVVHKKRTLTAGQRRALRNRAFVINYYRDLAKKQMAKRKIVKYDSPSYEEIADKQRSELSGIYNAILQRKLRERARLEVRREMAARRRKTESQLLEAYKNEERKKIMEEERQQWEREERARKLEEKRKREEERQREAASAALERQQLQDFREQTRRLLTKQQQQEAINAMMRRKLHDEPDGARVETRMPSAKSSILELLKQQNAVEKRRARQRARLMQKEREREEQEQREMRAKASRRKKQTASFREAALQLMKEERKKELQRKRVQPRKGSKRSGRQSTKAVPDFKTAARRLVKRERRREELTSRKQAPHVDLDVPRPVGPSVTSSIRQMLRKQEAAERKRLAQEKRMKEEEERRSKEEERRNKIDLQNQLKRFKAMLGGAI